MKKILLIDDSRVQRKVIMKTIQDAGFSFEYLQASNGQEAIDLMPAHAQDIGLILCDWNMPVMSGLEFLEALKKILPDNKLDILMVTTEATDSKIDRIKEVYPNIAGYLTKPFTPEEFITGTLPFLIKIHAKS